MQRPFREHFVRLELPRIKDKRDPQLLKLARHDDTRGCLLLVGAILDTPGLAERLLGALRPELARQPDGSREERAPS